MDRRKLRFGEYEGGRVTVRLGHRQREYLRRLSAQLGMSESELLREGLEVMIDGLLDRPRERPADSI